MWPFISPSDALTSTDWISFEATPTSNARCPSRFADGTAMESSPVAGTGYRMVLVVKLASTDRHGLQSERAENTPLVSSSCVPGTVSAGNGPGPSAHCTPHSRKRGAIARPTGLFSFPALGRHQACDGRSLDLVPPRQSSHAACIVMTPGSGWAAPYPCEAQLRGERGSSHVATTAFAAEPPGS